MPLSNFASEEKSGTLETALIHVPLALVLCCALLSAVCPLKGRSVASRSSTS